MDRKQNKVWKPEPGSWLVFRTDSQIQNSPIDIYAMVQIPTLYVYGCFVVQGTRPKKSDVQKLLNDGFKKDGSWPQILTLPKEDPCESSFREIAESQGVRIVTQPQDRLEPYAAPFKQEFTKVGFSQAGMLSKMAAGEMTAEEQCAKASIPDSYDPCPCACGKKYKFCCKKIFREVVMAMCAAEAGRFKQALDWMAKAKAISGETAEILCRYAIVYSFFDRSKSNELLQECLRLFPNYPRAYYILAIDLKSQGESAAAFSAYQNALARYLPTDKYHLNEVWNNLGTLYFESADYAKAKAAWEQALVYLPADDVVKNNLADFIYTNPLVPAPLRKPSPFLQHLVSRK